MHWFQTSNFSHLGMAISHIKAFFRSATQWVAGFSSSPEFDARTSNGISDLNISNYPEEEAKRIREFLSRLEDTEAIGPGKYVGMQRDPATDRYWDYHVQQQGHGMWYEYRAVDSSVAENRLANPEELERFKREGRWTA